MKDAALFFLLTGWVLMCGGAALASEEAQKESAGQNPPALSLPPVVSEKASPEERKAIRRPLPPAEVIQNLELFQSLPLLRDLDLLSRPSQVNEGDPKCPGARSAEGCAGGAR